MNYPQATQATTNTNQGLKHLKFKLGWKDRKVYGGPFFASIDFEKDQFFTIKMAKEISLPCDVNVPTEDFSIPRKKDLHNGLVLGLKALANGKDVYVGCMGGIGRTGIYMAVMAKVFGHKDPISWVRTQYHSRAVETSAQREFVMTFPIHDLQLIAQKLHRRNLLMFWK